MHVTPRTRRLMRLQHLIFVVLFLLVVGLLAWLSSRYSVHSDWTAAGRNTLSEASGQMLARMDGPLAITAYAREGAMVREGVAQLVERYRRQKRDITLEFVNPDHIPDQVRRLGISVDGELLVHYAKRSEHVLLLTETALTNALQKVARGGARWIAYLGGHGERALLGGANHDLGQFGEQLEARGFTVQELLLSEAGAIPHNTTALVIAQPRIPLLPREHELIEDYVSRGGNLLWLGDPGNEQPLAGLSDLLGFSFQAGTVVDPTARMFGIQHPAVVVVTNYGPHPVTAGFRLVTLFPHAAGIAWQPPPGWNTTGIMRTGLRSWSEAGELEGDITLDADNDIPGPLDIGIAMSRPLPPARADAPGDSQRNEQRIIVVGDGDFLSNAYLGNGGNLDLGLNMFNWLSNDEVLIDIPAKTAPDLAFDLSRGASIVVALGGLIGVPLIYLACGAGVWLVRRRH